MSKLTALLVFNQYQQLGGEEIVVQNEAQNLRDHGHEVHVLSISNHEIVTRWDVLNVALNAPYSQRSRVMLKGVLSKIKPDIMHVHNFFPLLTPSIFDASDSEGVPSILTLHNYRLLCAGANLSRDGKICEICVRASPYSAVKYRCYRQSSLASLAVARMIARHRRAGTWQNRVTRFIALSEFSKSKFIQGEFPPEKISVKGNFMKDPLPDSPEHTTAVPGGHSALYLGRLSSEKGVRTLIEAWRSMDIPLRVVGDGPQLLALKEQAPPPPLVEFLGHCDREKVEREIRRASFLVVPSECYETFSMATMEAYAHGKPVIASRIGALQEIVTDGVTGLHFESGNSDNLVAKAKQICENPKVYSELCRGARNKYLSDFSPKVNYENLEQIYRQAQMDFKRKTL